MASRRRPCKPHAQTITPPAWTAGTNTLAALPARCPCCPCPVRARGRGAGQTARARAEWPRARSGDWRGERPQTEPRANRNRRGGSPLSLSALPRWRPNHRWPLWHLPAFDATTSPLHKYPPSSPPVPTSPRCSALRTARPRTRRLPSRLPATGKGAILVGPADRRRPVTRVGGWD
ncbi:hypothetical protein PVAP13_3NG141002 [Panicum virgatum]|uniref:Uncharacterized protein n=1 Tax=Panicum virgatum TaxID=38727 RepID=A0A8T0UA38_PANVG|nr:hypothetical protein PVAP13_3NG141002 [Panicum virgatum]